MLCADEKSQIQALDPTQPGLAIKPGRAGTMTHDYKRHGTTTLLAAMNTATGKVISLCQQRHRHKEWIRFLRLIGDATPAGKQIHIIAGNYATHKHAKVRNWLDRHRRFHVHFTPTSSSWGGREGTAPSTGCGAASSAACWSSSPPSTTT